MDAAKILDMLADRKETLDSFGVKRIGLFGSYVRGEQNIHSDIDLIVEFDKDKKSFDSYMDLKFFLEELLDKNVDLVTAESIRPEVSKIVLRDLVYA